MPEPRRRFGDGHHVSENKKRQKRLRSLYFRSTQEVRKGSGNEARRIAANIAKLPELRQRVCHNNTMRETIIIAAAIILILIMALALAVNFMPQ
jgi:hypothetical protein